ncbi:hypothetical protein LSM04_004281 [Trypanosoma melophagium]|uniref:uncharacterized protein n=1 Tax=Trypanosoma melophagium TaxID=715481 RepID=UPI00351A5F68|nr:hypothetical protein LSM04_004281 [Trypanosoma melophagium]
MLLSEEELSAITLRSPFVYDYGDMPYFGRCVNEFPLRFFVRYRASRDDPSHHRWSRVLEVVHRQSDNNSSNGNNTINSNNNNNNSTTSSEVCPLKWKDKHFFIALRVEGEEKCVELPRLSSKLPTAEEVMAYCASHAEREKDEKDPPSKGIMVNDGIDIALESSTARAQLPTRREIQQMRSFRQSTLIQHTWTPEELAEMRERQAQFGPISGVGSAPVRLTVNTLHNMRLETELGIASSRRATGHTAMALERRTEPVLLNRNSQTQTIGITARGTTGSLSQSQSQGGGGFVSGTSLADLAPIPLSPLSPQFSQEMGGTPSISSPVLSQKFLERWEESKQCEDYFYAYVKDERRSAYMSKITRITQQNYELNKRDRLRGIDNEKRLDRKGNLLESGGLWIVDDQRRAQLAHKYQMEQDGETAGTTGGNDGKKTTVDKTTEDATMKDNGNNTTAIPTPPSLREEDAMLQRFISERKSQELLSFASVPDEFMDIETATTTTTVGVAPSSLTEENGMEALQRQLPSTSTRSPELLLLGASPRVVTSQLVHQVVSSSMRRAATYSSSPTEHVEGTQSAARSVVGEQPPRKVARHA